MDWEGEAGTREEREKHCNKSKMPLSKKKLLDMIFLIFFPDFKYCLSIKNQCVKAFWEPQTTKGLFLQKEKGKWTSISLLSNNYLSLLADIGWIKI